MSAITWFVTDWRGRLLVTDNEVRAKEMCSEYARYYKTPFDTLYGSFSVCPVVRAKRALSDRCGFSMYVPASMLMGCPDKVFAIWGEKATCACQDTLFVSSKFCC